MQVGNSRVWFAAEDCGDALKPLLDAITRGQRVVITRGGEAVAKVRPAKASRAKRCNDTLTPEAMEVWRAWIEERRVALEAMSKDMEPIDAAQTIREMRDEDR